MTNGIGPVAAVPAITDVELKRGVRVRVSFTGTVVAKPHDGAIRILVDHMPSWHAVVPTNCVTAENQRCFWIKDGDRCELATGHLGGHRV